MALNEHDIIDIKDALIKTLEALDWAFFGGKATPGDRYRLRDTRDTNEIGAPIHEALLKLKGETKPPEPRKAILSPETEAVLYQTGQLVLHLGHSMYAETVGFSPEETKRLTSFLRDGA